MNKSKDSENRKPGRLLRRTRTGGAFTLIEVMVSMVVLAIMMMLIAQIIGTTQKSWRSASSRLAQFREARIAFDTITRNLRQATLNPYRDFHYVNGAGVYKNIPPSDKPTDPPDGFVKISELAFVSGQAKTLVTGRGLDSVSGHAVFFQAPLGVTDEPGYANLKNLLCGRGYFVQFGSDKPYLPVGLKDRLPEKNRFRLMEYQPPAENNTIYQADNSWYTVDNNYLRPVSDKIVGLVISPRFAAGDDSVLVNGTSQKPTDIAPNYIFDSRETGAGTMHDLPPVVRVSMMALDDASLATLLEKSGGGASLNMLEMSGAKFENANNYEEDLNSFKEYMSGLKLNYRVFESYVSIPASGL